MLVTRLLRDSFADIIDESYTARLEEELDEIEEGKLDWVKSLSQFNKKFNKDLTKAQKEMRTVKGEGIKTDEKFTYPGFGTFEIRTRRARTGVNPRNPTEKIQIPETKNVGFTASKALKDQIGA